MANKRPDLSSLISGASSDIQPIKRGSGLQGLIGGQRPPAEPGPPGEEPEQQLPAEPAERPAADQPHPADQSASAAPLPAHQRRPPRAAATRPARATTATGSRSAPGASETGVRKGRRIAAEEHTQTGTRQNKTIRLKPDLARSVAVDAARRSAFEYALIEEAIDAFLAAGTAPEVTRPRNAAEAASRVRKSYTLRPDIIRDVAVQAALWDVFEYEIFEAALEAYLPSR